MLLMFFTVYHIQAISSKLASGFTKCGGEPILRDGIRHLVCKGFIHYAQKRLEWRLFSGDKKIPLWIILLMDLFH